jgi:hypothetical protein
VSHAADCEILAATSKLINTDARIPLFNRSVRVLQRRWIGFGLGRPLRGERLISPRSVVRQVFCLGPAWRGFHAQGEHRRPISGMHRWTTHGTYRV